MQHQNDNMDELFRKAAEGYPLNTGNADWEKVHARLSSKEEPVRESSRKGRLLWLLTLLSVMLICTRISDALLSVPGTTVVRQLTNPTTPGKHPALTMATTKSAVITATARSTAVKRNARSYTLPSVTNKTSFDPPVQVGKNTPDEFSEKPVLATSGFHRYPVVAIAPTRLTQSVIYGTTVMEDRPAPVLFSRMPTIASNEKIDTASLAAKTVEPENAKTKPLKQRRFFVSLVAGPDLSNVRFQEFSEVGYQAGLLLGYKLSGRFAVEAGVLSSSKYYYSDGEYANASKVYVPANAELMALEGNCRMIELPLSLRYTFSEKKKHSWFASAGLVSYLMSSEDYSYDYYYPNTGYIYTHRSNYQNETKNWFSILQLTAGYMSKLGSVGHLRVEPYYSLPIKGVGYGELPISSIGLRLGLTSKYF